MELVVVCCRCPQESKHYAEQRGGVVGYEVCAG